MFGGVNAAEKDFLRWMGENAEGMHEHPVEGLPEGVPTMTSRYGMFGAKALNGGLLGERHLPPPCLDAEAVPPPPCQATGECKDLLKLGREFELSANRAHESLANALAAIAFAKVLFRRVDKAADALVRSPLLSQLAEDARPAPGGSEWRRRDLIDKMLMPPIKEDYWPVGHFQATTSRVQERWDLDNRIQEYLKTAEDDSALSWPYGEEHIPQPYPLAPAPIQVAALPLPLLPVPVPRARRWPSGRRSGTSTCTAPIFHRARRRDAFSSFLGSPQMAEPLGSSAC